MPEATGRDPEARTELASTAEDLTAVSRDRDSLRHQLADAGQRMSEVRTTHQALQQKIQERRSVLTDRHVEVSDADRKAHPATTV